MKQPFEGRNKRVAWYVAIASQVVMLLLFYLIVAWRAPVPPIPQFGIELGFMQMTSMEGGSAETAPIISESSEQVNQTSESESETDQVLEESSETEEAVAEVVEVPEDEIEAEEIQTADENVAEAPVSEVSQEHEVLEETPDEVQTEEVVPEPTIDERALYQNTGTGENSSDGEGASLALAGWIWDFQPVPNDDSQEVGKIVYRISVDQEGYLVKIETLSSTVSPIVERKYRQAVQKLTFSKTSDYTPAAISSGTITFIIKSR